MQDKQKFNSSRPYTAISAEDYAAFTERIIAQEVANRQKTGIGLQPSSSECKAIETMCAGLSVAILEIFAGRRPVNHIAKWLSKDCYEKVSNRAQLTRDTLRRRYARVPINQSPYSKNLVLPKPRRARAQQISTNVFEVCLIMEDFSRVRAMAIRVEKIFKAWKITAIEIA